MFLWFPHVSVSCEGMRYGYPSLRGTHYEERKTYLYETEVDWTKQLKLRGDKQAATAPLAFGAGRKLVA